VNPPETGKVINKEPKARGFHVKYGKFATLVSELAILNNVRTEIAELLVLSWFFLDDLSCPLVLASPSVP
jgi:hypothetical protein